MATEVKLSKGQYQFLASTFRTLSEGIVLGSSAAFFLPETFNIAESITFTRYVFMLAVGLIILTSGAILVKKGER